MFSHQAPTHWPLHTGRTSSQKQRHTHTVQILNFSCHHLPQELRYLRHHHAGANL